MAEQTDSLARNQITSFCTSYQCFGDLRTPEEEPWCTGASSPFLDYLLTEGNEGLESLVARNAASCSSFYKVGENFDMNVIDHPLQGARRRLNGSGIAAPDCGSPSWQNSRRSEDVHHQLDDDCTEVLSAVGALYDPLLPHTTSRKALHPIAEQDFKLPSSDDFEPWSFLCEAVISGCPDMPQLAVERYNSTDSCASLVRMPLDIDMALCDSPTSPAWALASHSSKSMLLDMPAVMSPPDGVAGGLHTGMSWGSPAYTAPATDPLALLSEDAMLEDLPCVTSMKPDIAHQPAACVEEHTFPAPLSIWQDLSQPGPINTSAAGAVAPPPQGMSSPSADMPMAAQDAAVAWHQQLAPGADSGCLEVAQATQETRFCSTPAAFLGVPAQAPAGSGFGGRPCGASTSESAATPQRRKQARCGSRARACGTCGCRALYEPPAGMGPTAFTFAPSNSLVAFLEQHMGPLTATPPRDCTTAEPPMGCPQAPKACRTLDLHPGLSQAAESEDAACQSTLRLPPGNTASHGGALPFPVWQGMCKPEPLAHGLGAAPSPGKEAPTPAAAAADKKQEAMAAPAPGPAPKQAAGRKVRPAAAPSRAARTPANQIPPAARQAAAAAAAPRAAAQLKTAIAAIAAGTQEHSLSAGLRGAAGVAAAVIVPSTPLKLPNCPSGPSSRQPGCPAQSAAVITAAAVDEAGSDGKAGNDCNDDNRSCTTMSDDENRGAKRNRAHQKDYTQRKRSRVAAVHNCALELKKRRAELEGQVATAIAKHQSLTDSLPWQKQLEEARFMAMLGNFRTGALKEQEKAGRGLLGSSGPTYMQDPLEVCKSIVWTGGHGATGRARTSLLSWTDEMASMQDSMSPVARRVLSGAADDTLRAAGAQAPPMSEIVAKIRLTRAQKSELAAEARRTVTSMEMMHDDSAAATERLQGSLPLSLGCLHNIWRGMLVTHTVLGQLSGIPKMAAECSAHLVSTVAEVLKPAQAKKLPYPVHGSLSMCMSLCEEVERIRHRQGAICRASVVADAAPVTPKAAVTEM